MKKLFYILFMLIASRTAYGQVELRYGSEIDGGWGDAGSVVTPYVVFPEELVKPYGGNSITTVHIGLAQDASNCYLYLKRNPEDAKYIYRQKLGDLTAGWNEIILDEPYAITGEESVAIGYKASFSKGGGVGVSDEKNANGDKVYYNSLDKWTSTGGSICIKALVEGNSMPENEMGIGRMADVTAPYDAESVTFTTVVSNLGANAVESYSIDITVDDKTEEKTYIRQIPVNGCDTVRFEVPSVEKGKHTVTVYIKSVNGADDSYEANNRVSAQLTVRDIAFARRVLCEEITGTWCGFCPRGMVGLELMKENHPDLFIPVSIHSNDPLEIDSLSDYSYKDFIDSCPGAPMCNVNRRLTGDPFTDIRRLFDLESSVENHIALETEAVWDDEGKIQVRNIYYSDIDIESPSFRTAYTLTEDSITGYPQTNYYAGGRNGEMYGWEEKEDPAKDAVFNDVARAIFGSYSGIPLPTEPMTAFTRYEHEYTIELPATVNDARNIHIIGQIIDTGTNCILNASSTTVEGNIPGTVMASEEAGVKVTAGPRGIVIYGEGLAGARASVFDTGGRKVAGATLTDGENHIHMAGHGAFLVNVTTGKTAKTYKLIL